MKKACFYAMLLLALVAAGVAYSAASPSANLRKQDRVYGGGHISPGCFTNSDLCFEGGRNFAVDVHAEGDGREAAGNSTYGAPGAFESHRSITCMRVNGSSAVVGGIIESGTNSMPGYWYVQYYVDRGGPALGNRDLVSPQFSDAAGSPGWPVGFPYTCPSPTTGFPGAAPVYREVDGGDVVVQDAPND